MLQCRKAKACKRALTQKIGKSQYPVIRRRKAKACKRALTHIHLTRNLLASQQKSKSLQKSINTGKPKRKYKISTSRKAEARFRALK